MSRATDCVIPGPSPTLEINEKVAEARAAGLDVLHLGFGESRFPPPPFVEAELGRHSGATGYPPVAGLPELRDVVAEHLSRGLERPVSGADVIIGPGSKTLLYAVLMAIGQPLILESPSWVSYEPQARMCGLDVHRLPGDPGRNYQWSLDDLSQIVAAIGDAGACLMINSPNNPTGRMLDPSFVESLAEFCAASRITVISDEIYSRVGHGSVKHTSISRFIPSQTAVVTGASKHLSLGGWRLGIAALPEGDLEFRRTVLAIASEIWSSASAPIQHAAVAAFTDTEELNDHVDACSSLHAARTRHLWEGLREAGIRCPEPHGGFYVMPDFDDCRDGLAAMNVTTSADLARWLLDEHSIASLPGSAFGLDPSVLALRLASSFIDLEEPSSAETMLHQWINSDGSSTFVGQHHPRMDRAIAELASMVSSVRI